MERKNYSQYAFSPAFNTAHLGSGTRLDGVGLRGGDVALVADYCEASQVGAASMGRAESVAPGEYTRGAPQSTTDKRD